VQLVPFTQVTVPLVTFEVLGVLSETFEPGVGSADCITLRDSNREVKFLFSLCLYNSIAVLDGIVFNLPSLILC
jgi:hypothetical protein